MSEPSDPASGSQPPPSRATPLRPWIALLLPPLAWYGFEIGLASVLRVTCAPVGSWLGPTWGAAALVVCAASAWLAWPLAARPADDRTASPAWLAAIALVTAGIFALAIAFQTLATLIVPPCTH